MGDSDRTVVESDGRVVDEIVAALEAKGYATIPGAADDAQVAEARRELEGILATTPPGRDDFEGRLTRRVDALFAKTRALDALATHPVVLDVLDRVLGDYQLSAPAAIAIGRAKRPRSCIPTTPSTP